MSKKTLHIQPQTTPLRGTVTVPSDKSISHRSVLLGGIAKGTSYVRNWLPAGDTKATLSAMRSMGVKIDVTEQSPTSWDLVIEGRGMYGLQPSAEPLDFVNAGTGIRLAAGIMAGQNFPSVLDGSSQLRKRPMRRITDPLSQMHAHIETTEGRAPMHVTPAQMYGILYELPVASAQVKSAVLLAGLYAKNRTYVVEPAPARDHTERMLAAMGANILVRGNVIRVEQSELTALDMRVPADPSSAAFPLVAAAIVPHSEVTLTSIGMNYTRTGIVDMLKLMGAEISVSNEQETGGEPIADLHISFSEMHSASIDGDTVVRGIDELPIWSVATSQAAGASTVKDAAELRVKEVDRISVLAGELQKMGVNMIEHDDGFTVEGPVRPKGAVVDSNDDHRLGMSLAIMGLIADGPTIVEDAGCIADSFPGFVETMQALGANMQWGTS